MEPIWARAGVTKHAKDKNRNLIFTETPLKSMDAEMRLNLEREFQINRGGDTGGPPHNVIICAG
jgi:hypothetical protein